MYEHVGVPIYNFTHRSGIHQVCNVLSVAITSRPISILFRFSCRALRSATHGCVSRKRICKSFSFDFIKRRLDASSYSFSRINPFKDDPTMHSSLFALRMASAKCVTPSCLFLYSAVIPAWLNECSMGNSSL